MTGLYAPPVLAVALPLSLDEVNRQLEEPEQQDYARAMQGPTQGYTAEFVWQNHFKPVAEHFRELATDLSRLGVEVKPRLKESDLSQLFNQTRPVTIVAHWKGARLLPGDIRDTGELARRILDGSDRVCSVVRSLVDQHDLERLAASGETLGNRVDLARVLNIAITSGTWLFRSNLPADVRLVLLPLEVEECNRQQLDAWFEDLIITGNRIELHDGLMSPPEFAAHIPANYSGTIHAVNCHSVLLQRAISAPCRRVLASEDVIPPLPFFELYRSVAGMLRDGRTPYEKLWLKLLEDLQSSGRPGNDPIGLRSRAVAWVMRHIGEG